MPPKPTVGLARCLDYNPVSVQEALEKAVSLAGGMPFQSVETLLKVNLLAPQAPEKAVTTHPEIARALIRLLRQNSAESICIADSPGYVYAPGFTRLLEITGYRQMAEEESVPAVMLSDKGVIVPEGNPKVLFEPRIARRYYNAPCVINVAKLKTHVETEISGCIKNIFGTADTQTRKKAHQSPSKWHLAEAILDLFEVRPPEFNILDAVVAMEGNGPSRGTPPPCRVDCGRPQCVSGRLRCCLYYGICGSSADSYAGCGCKTLGRSQLQERYSVSGSLLGGFACFGL